jgi:flagellar biosynthesis GTPase FlhF
MKILSAGNDNGRHCTSLSPRWVRVAIFCGVALVTAMRVETANCQLSKSDQLRFQQQQAAMERTARESMERMERQRIENERIAREARERQAALMEENRRRQAESLARQKEANEKALERQKELQKSGQEMFQKVQEDIKDREQKLEEYRQRQEARREQREEADADSSDPGADSSNYSSSSTDTPKTSTSTALSTSRMPGEKFPETRTRIIPDEEAAELSYGQLRYALNEIYARHGADFATKPELRQVFSNYSWYTPRDGTDYDSIEADFTATERANVETLAKYRDQKR